MTRRCRRILVGAAVVSLWLLARPWLAAPAAAAEAVLAPTHDLPTRIVLGWAGDAARSQAVTWRTERLVATPVAQIALATAGSDLAAKALTVSGEGQTVGVGDEGGAFHYRATFTSLEPATRYVYRVGDGQAWSEWNSFVTAASEPAPFRFIYLGDVQNEIRSVWSRVVRAAYAAAPDARFIAYAGDLLAEGYDDRLWGEWCDGQGFISASIPSLPAPGNHDLHRPPGSPAGVLGVSPLWRAHFAAPPDGPAGLDELTGQNYFVDYQGARVIALDVNCWANADFVASERDRVQQATLAWLQKSLGQNPNRWTIVLQHQSVYSIAKNRDYASMRAALVPLYDKYGVDLVLQGHDHAYARSQKLVANEIAPAAGRGTVYVISVSGAKMYPLHRANQELMACLMPERQMYQVVSVAPARLTFDAYGADGALVDAFDLRKRGRLTSVLVDRRPAARRAGRARRQP